MGKRKKQYKLRKEEVKSIEKAEKQPINEFWKIDVLKDSKIKNLFKNKIFKFVFLFSVFILFFYFLFLIFADKIDFIRNIVANNVGFLLKIVGINANVINSVIIMENFSMEVIFECTPLFTMLIFFSCVLAYPAKIDAKIKGILIGLIGIYIIDILRLFSLALIGKLSPSLFNYIHTYLWQITLIIIVLMMWLFWIDKFTKIPNNKNEHK